MAEDQVTPDFIPDSESPPETPATPDFIPDEPKEQTPDFIPDEPIQQKQYDTTGQQALAGVEGAAQGVLGPLAPLIETKMLGIKPEDIAARAEANPVTRHVAELGALAGSAALGIPGEAMLLTKAGEAAANLAKLGKIGSAALKGGLEMAALQGSDEISKHIIQTPDPNDSAANALLHMAYAGILGSATGGLLGISGLVGDRGLKAIENSKIINRSKSYLSGAGAAHSGIEKPIYDPFIKQYTVEGGKELDKTAWEAGYKFQKELPDLVTKKAIDYATQAIGFKTGGLPGWYITSKYIEPVVEKVLKRPMTSVVRRAVMPFINKALTSNTTDAIPEALEYGIQSARGAQKLHHSLNMLFNVGPQQLFDASIDQNKRQKIENGINENVLDQQIQNEQQQSSGYAEGGVVKPAKVDHFASLFPVENMIMQSAKSRIYNHLKTLKPSPKQGLAFDNNEPTKEQKREYDTALDLATNPLSILSHIKKGTLTGNNISHMNSMWPELTRHLQKKITERITQAQLNGEKPPYKLLQGLSLFMGTPLESTFTPTSILAAQSVFMPKAPQQPAQGAPKLKRGTSKLGDKTNKMYKTPDQSGEEERVERR